MASVLVRVACAVVEEHEVLLEPVDAGGNMTIDVESEDSVSSDEGEDDDESADEREDNVDDDDESEDEASDDGESDDEIALLEHKADWDSDDDNIINIPDDEPYFGGHIDFLGFLPFKEEPASMAAAAYLPDDVLADVLRWLPARSLTASSSVCKAWRAIIDEQQLLLQLWHLLPHSVCGIFVNHQDHGKPHFFARPTAAPECPRIDGRYDFIELEDRYNWTSVLDHSNGLVLYFDRDCS
ncbi:hypothetical protein PR202_ga22687 [Eleusine coracana subsp. coracana]|uniref:F-box domain-containing protein n=1 Tax=Eleusine coracana subsp. coracana TaxID=191504 RepID=A0AAV5D3V5_ELECO|nr:hypothetical protein PR202_ga22687 [Eleusine coracana subsp. coracana]